jgi:hypothetical protein
VGVKGAAKRIDVFATASSDASPFRTSCTST